MPMLTQGHNVLLAPMAGMTDLAFRSLCVEYGADLTFSEMVSAKGLSYGSEKTEALLELAPNEKQIAVQIFGHEPDTMAREAAHIQDILGNSLYSIDINMGCPARKIVKKGDGSSLMRDPDTASRIVSQVRAAVGVPVSVKFRRGYFLGEDTCVEFAKKIEDAGADIITLHPRYAMQYYKGNAEWDCIARVKKSVSIPVVGNGDICSGADAVSLIELSGCDHIMVGRAALGNPWIFQDIKAALSGKASVGQPSIKDRMNVAKRHARLLADMSDKALLKMRKHAHHYISGLPGASAARRELSMCSTLDEFDSVFDALVER